MEGEEGSGETESGREEKEGKKPLRSGEGGNECRLVLAFDRSCGREEETKRVDRDFGEKKEDRK
jgi:hypothetical protein